VTRLLFTSSFVAARIMTKFNFLVHLLCLPQICLNYALTIKSSICVRCKNAIPVLMFIHFIVERHHLEDFLKLNCKTGLRTSNVLKLKVIWTFTYMVLLILFCATRNKTKINFITTPFIISMKAIDNCDKKENIYMPQW
jgi:hypothetical protein